jgi:hypothetical protein
MRCWPSFIGSGMAVIVHIAATSSPLQSSSSAHWSSLLRSHPLAANYAHYPGRALLELDRE